MLYEITSEKQALFDKLLDLLKEFNRVCEDNNIRYFVFAGTMLGAIRHKGFIPWDDDIDVVLPRKDYNKLKIIAENGAFKEPYFFQNPSTDRGYPKGFCRLRNSNSTEISLIDVYMKCNSGIFIDIFPLDVLPEDELLRKKLFKELHYTRACMNAFSRYYSGFGTIGTNKIKEIGYYLLLPLFKIGILRMDKLYRKYDKIVSQFNNSNGKYVGTIAVSFEEPRFIFERKYWESEVIYVDFEGMKVPVPKDYDALLKHSYGDYMTPVQAPTCHGETLFSVTTPYKQYIEEHFDELKRDWYRLTEVGRKEQTH